MIRRAIERRSVATLATVSALGQPHAATVLYRCIDKRTVRRRRTSHSRKARNITERCRCPVHRRAAPAHRPTSQHPVPVAGGRPQQRRRRDHPSGNGGQARSDHGPRRDGPRRRLRPAPGRPGQGDDLRPGNVVVAGDAQPARRSRRGAMPSPPLEKARHGEFAGIRTNPARSAYRMHMIRTPERSHEPRRRRRHLPAQHDHPRHRGRSEAAAPPPAPATDTTDITDATARCLNALRLTRRSAMCRRSRPMTA